VELVLPQISLKHAGQDIFKVNQDCTMNKNKGKLKMAGSAHRLIFSEL
jgi:hypothetical protein